MGFKAIRKRFHQAKIKSAEGAEHFIQTSPEKVTNHTEIDAYLNDFKCLKPKMKSVKKNDNSVKQNESLD